MRENVDFRPAGEVQLGAVRQELIFARHLAHAGRPPGWLGVPLVLTSHTWENAKNEQSHQDPTIGEALLGEMSDTSRVLFPVDGNSAAAALRAVYAQRAQVACMVVSKRDSAQRFDDFAGQIFLVFLAFRAYWASASSF